MTLWWSYSQILNYYGNQTHYCIYDINVRFQFQSKINLVKILAACKLFSNKNKTSNKITEHVIWQPHVYIFLCFSLFIALFLMSDFVSYRYYLNIAHILLEIQNG